MARDAHELRGQIDVGVITIRPDEAKALSRRLGRPERITGLREYDFNQVTTVTRDRRLVISVRSPEEGQGMAQKVATNLIADFDPRWLLLVGICGSFPSDDFTLGDVIIASRVSDFSVAAALDDKDNEFDLRGTPVHTEVEALLGLPDLSSYLESWGTREAVGRELPRWNVPEDAASDSLYGHEEWRERVHAALSGHWRVDPPFRDRIVYPGPVGTSNTLLKDTRLATQLQQALRKLTSVEMELGGVMLAARSRSGDYPVLSIRGVSDIVGLRRNPDWTAYACDSAASCAYSFIRSELLERRRASGAARPVGAVTIEPLFCHVHPLEKDFVGRSRERSDLTLWASGQGPRANANVLMLRSIGGMGKSSLAWLWSKADVAGQSLDVETNVDATLPRVAGRYSGLIFWSYYAAGSTFQAFLESTIQYVTEGATRRDDFVRGTGSDTWLDYNSLQGAVLQSLGSRRILVIWDGAERLLREYTGATPDLRVERPSESIDADTLRCADQAIVDFLQFMAAQHSSRLLVVTRLPFDDVGRLAGVEEMILGGLSAEDSVEYFRRRGVRGTAEQLRQAASEFGHHPLSLSLLAASLTGDLDAEGDISARVQHDPTQNLIARRDHILGLAYGRRSAARRELLSVLAAVRGLVPKALIQAWERKFRTSKSSSLGRDLGALVRHGLLDYLPDRGEYVLHPVVRRYAYSKLRKKTATHAFIADWLLTHTRSLPGEPQGVNDLSNQIEVFVQLARAKKDDRAFGYFKDVLNQFFFYRFSNFSLMVELLVELFPKGIAGDVRLPEHDRGTLFNDTGLAFMRSGQLREAATLLQRAREAHIDFFKRNSLPPSIREAGKAAEGLAKTKMQLGELAAARSHVDEARDAYKQSGYARGLRIVDQVEGDLLCLMGEYSRARSLLKGVLDYSEEDRDKLGVVICRVALARVARFEDRIPEAISEARAALDGIERLVHPAEALKTEATALLASGLVGNGSLQEAEPLLEDALKRSRRMGDLALETGVLIERARALHFADAKKSARQGLGNDSPAVGEAQAALSIADYCEFRILQADAHLCLARLYMDWNTSDSRRHAEEALERATCGVDPQHSPYLYARGYGEALDLLR